MQASEVSEVWMSVTQRFCEALKDALGGACDASWQVSRAEQAEGTQPEGASAVSFRCVFVGSCAGEALLIVPHATLGGLSLRGAAKRKAQIAKLLSAFEGCMAGLAGSLDESGATSARIEVVEQLELKDERVVELLVHREGDTASGDGTAMGLHLCLSQGLLSAIQADTAEPFVFPDAAESHDANLDLVMDVELNVTLRFGQRLLALREVLELNSGSVVELDRQVDEPVELVLDGRVVARGEAVIIDGNYGMRITQLLQNTLP